MAGFTEGKLCCHRIYVRRIPIGLVQIRID